jgi:hypothetical protein
MEAGESDVIQCLEEQRIILEDIAHGAPAPAARGPHALGRDVYGSSPNSSCATVEGDSHEHSEGEDSTPWPQQDPERWLADQIERRVTEGLGPHAAAATWADIRGGHDDRFHHRRAGPQPPTALSHGHRERGTTTRWPNEGGPAVPRTDRPDEPVAHQSLWDVVRPPHAPVNVDPGPRQRPRGAAPCWLASFSRLGITHCGCLDGLPCIATRLPGSNRPPDRTRSPESTSTDAASLRAVPPGIAKRAGHGRHSEREAARDAPRSRPATDRRRSARRQPQLSMDESDVEDSFSSLRHGLEEMNEILHRLHVIFPPD